MKVLWYMPPTQDTSGAWCRCWKVVDLPDHLARQAVEDGQAVDWPQPWDEDEVPGAVPG